MDFTNAEKPVFSLDLVSLPGLDIPALRAKVGLFLLFDT
jgi:hypothetical protein